MLVHSFLFIVRIPIIFYWCVTVIDPGCMSPMSTWWVCYPHHRWQAGWLGFVATQFYRLTQIRRGRAYYSYECTYVVMARKFMHHLILQRRRELCIIIIKFILDSTPSLRKKGQESTKYASQFRMFSSFVVLIFIRRPLISVYYSWRFTLQPSLFCVGTLTTVLSFIAQAIICFLRQRIIMNSMQ